VEEMIAMAVKHPNVFLGASGHAPRYWDPSMVRFINSRGQDKVMWGTDYPLLGHKEALEQIEQLGLKEEAKRKLLRDNAARVFKL
jgi:predicted TIM-barrel fold metal-dependent hydrolase